MRAIGKSVVGMCRKNNEDTIYVSDETTKLKNVFIIADGMGGCNAGEVASATAVQTFLEFFTAHANNLDEDKTEILDLLVDSVSYANKMVFEKSKESEDLLDMGTTFIATIIGTNKIYVIYVGDSRVYLYRKQETICQLTTDHSYVMELVKNGTLSLEEAANHPKRNIITRAVGIQEKVEADAVIEPIQENDLILLCSDGLSCMLSDEEIESILEEEIDMEQKVEKLIDMANQKGGYDNISLILIQR